MGERTGKMMKSDNFKVKKLNVSFSIQYAMYKLHDLEGNDLTLKALYFLHLYEWRSNQLV